MKRLVRFTLYFLLFGPAVLPAQAAFTSLHIFGDSVSTTTNNTSGGATYFGQRFTNGRVWVELLAERQGLSYISSQNWSYFGHYSINLVSNVDSFSPPPDAATALFIVWVCDADLYAETLNHGTNLTQWTDAINLSLTNHFKAITNLYAKGVRTLIMPNGVDVSLAPFFSGRSSANKGFVRQRVTEYNAGYAAMANQATALFPDLTIYVPDMFGLFNNVMERPDDYELTKTNIDALHDAALTDKSLSGPGADYVWWDNIDPSAKFHSHIADMVQQLVSPVQFSGITPLGGSNRLDITNVPIGRDGLVEGSADFASWTTAGNVASTNATQSVLVPTTEPMQFYRLRFPFTWTWP